MIVYLQLICSLSDTGAVRLLVCSAKQCREFAVKAASAVGGCAGAVGCKGVLGAVAVFQDGTTLPVADA